VEALGICVDGNELKFAHLRKVKKNLEILGLEKVFIKRAGGEPPQGETEEPYEDAFGLETQQEEFVKEEMVTPELGDNVIYNVISKYSQKNLKAGMNILQSDVSFTNISTDFGSKVKNLKKQIKVELDKISGDISEENFDFIKKPEKEYIAFYHNNKLELMNQILNVISDIKSEMKIQLVDINEIALMNLFVNLIQVDEEVSILVYVGNEFSRILFFHGKQLINFSQLINEGYRSSGLLANLYGKVIFELDTAEFEEINNIFIAGDGDLSKYQEYFKEKFPESNIARLPFQRLFSYLDEEQTAEIDSYAIPISLAWKILAGKDDNFIDTNFLPAGIRKKQKAFAIAWHGLVLFILIIASIAYFYQENKRIDNEINIIEAEKNKLISGIEEILPIALTVDSLSREINKIKPRIALVDSLKPKNMLYSDLLRFVSENIKDINSIWVNNFSGSIKTFSFSGNSLFRNRIYKLADSFEESKIDNVNSIQIMDKNIFNFNISGEIPEKK